MNYKYIQIWVFGCAEIIKRVDVCIYNCNCCPQQCNLHFSRRLSKLQCQDWWGYSCHTSLLSEYLTRGKLPRECSPDTWSSHPKKETTFVLWQCLQFTYDCFEKGTLPYCSTTKGNCQFQWLNDENKLRVQLHGLGRKCWDIHHNFSVRMEEAFTKCWTKGCVLFVVVGCHCHSFFLGSNVSNPFQGPVNAWCKSENMTHR